MTQNEMLKTESMKQPEQGRSMIEMLGTLAIMGVLSIGGIAGYGYAIDKYRANETIDELNKRAVIYATQVLNNTLQAGEYLSHGEYGDKTALGYTIEANNSYYPNEFEVTLTNYPSEVCRDILKNYMIPYQIVVANKVYDPDSDNYDICGNDGETAPETLFIYTADLNQGKEEFEGTPGGEVADCIEGEEFYAEGQCYPCNTTTVYPITTENEYALCRACGRRSILYGYGRTFCAPVCMAGQVYDTQLKKCLVPECSQNSDCTDKGEKYFCKLDFSVGGFNQNHVQKPPYGRCNKAIEATRKEVVGVGTYVTADSALQWWNAKNYCSAIGGRMATIADFGCGYDFAGKKETGQCNAEQGNKDSNKPLSANMQAFQSVIDNSVTYWLDDSYSESDAYYVSLRLGYITHYPRINYGIGNGHVLCRVGD